MFIDNRNILHSRFIKKHDFCTEEQGLTFLENVLNPSVLGNCPDLTIANSDYLVESKEEISTKLESSPIHLDFYEHLLLILYEDFKISVHKVDTKILKLIDVRESMERA